MKNIVILLLLTFNITFVYSQEKSIYGTFLFNQEVLNYKYTSHPNNLYTLKFFKWEDNSNQIKSIISIEELDKITQILRLNESINSEKSIDILAGFNYTELQAKIAEANSIIGFYDKLFDVITLIYENSKIISDKINGINLNSIYTLPADSDKLENAKTVISEYKKVNDQIEKIVTSSKTNQNEVSLYDIQVDTYKPVINSLITYLVNPITNSDSIELDKLSTRLFYELKTRMEFFDSQPLSGNILLTNNTTYLKKKPGSKENFQNLKKVGNPKITQLKLLEIEKVELEFASGGIKNVIVYAKSQTENQSLESIKLRNNIPFSISGKFDPEKFKKISLFADKSTSNDDDGTLIHLSDFLRYDISLSHNSEDYSPADTIITLSKTVPIAQVYKSKTSKILSARTFSDLIGIDGQQPNGLIQLEVYKRLNLVTNYYQRVFYKFSNTNYQGILSYIEPKFVITKIEENNRYLPLNRDTFQVLTNPNSLDVYRYQQFAFGVDLNLYNLNIQNYKSKFFLDFHYNIARTTAQDDSNQNGQSLIRLNVRNWGPKFYYQILPDSRFGFKMGYDAIKQIIQSDVITIDDPGKNWLGTAWFLANLKTNQKGSEMFFRLRFNHLLKDMNTNFLEVQVGYAFDILKSN